MIYTITFVIFQFLFKIENIIGVIALIGQVVCKGLRQTTYRDAKSKFSKSGVFRKKSGVYQEIFYEISKVIKRYSNGLTQVLTCLINANTPIHFATK